MVRQLATFLLGTGFLVLTMATNVDASTSYIARLGTTHGAARLTAGGPNAIYVNASGLASGSWTEALYQGTCSRLSTRIVTMPVLSVGSRGSIARTNTLTSSQARLARTGVIRLTRGAAAVCGAFAIRAVAVPTPTPRPTPNPSPTPGATPTPGPDPSAGTVLLDFSGRGNGTSQAFTAPANWEIDYIYDCSGPGVPGPFSITVNRSGAAPETPVSVTGMGGSDAIIEVARRGSVTLQISSGCDWEVIVVAN